MTATTAFSITVVGRVQGVGYRTFAQEAARRLGVTGFVANLPDGTVDVEVAGVAAAVVEFIKALRAGPPGSLVSDVHATPINASRVNVASFEIRA